MFFIFRLGVCNILFQIVDYDVVLFPLSLIVFYSNHTNPSCVSLSHELFQHLW